jgi:hypothetical protein
MADNLTVTRPNGTLDVFSVTPCSSRCAAGSFELHHAAVAPNGGQVSFNDHVGTTAQVINLFDAGWRSTNTVLYVRAFVQDGVVVEWTWQNGQWTGPVELHA